MKKIALFNHKGGVGKTTLTINIANAFANAGKTVLLVDADPQCNLTSFYLPENQLEKILEDSDKAGIGQTLWSAVKPVVSGRGAIKPISGFVVNQNKPVYLLPGDVLMADYEEVLPEAWTDCFARRTRGYDVTTALAKTVNRAGVTFGADICLYDVGPNVGALNRAVLLDCDAFITPVGADLFSLRALSTVGRAMIKWMKDWQTIKDLAPPDDKGGLLTGKPHFAGYITSAYKINSGRNASDPHADWEKKIAPRVRERIIKDLQSYDPALVPQSGGYKIGGVKNFHSLAPEAQKHGLAIGALRGITNSGNNPSVKEANTVFNDIAKEIGTRIGMP